MTAMVAPAPFQAPRRAGPLAKALLSDWFALWLSLALLAAVLPVLPALGTPATLLGLLREAWPLLVVALGQSLVLAAGHLDLSQGAVLGLASTLGAALVATVAPGALSGTPAGTLLLDGPAGLLDGQVWPAFLAMAAVGALAGLLNGGLVAWLALPSGVVTLASFLALGAVASWLTQSQDVRGLPDGLLALGRGELVSLHLGPRDGAPVPRRELHGLIGPAAATAIGLAVALHLLLGRTAFGRQLLAVGANRRAAEIAGVPVRRVIVLAFVLSGLCASLGAALYAARLGAGSPALGQGTFMLDVIAATLIGGASLRGGRAKVAWTVLGVLFLVLLSRTLGLLGLTAAQAEMAKAGLLLAAVLLDLARARLLRSRG